MRDFPMFTTENGIASLVLREVSYTQRAYIRLLDSQAPELLLQECRDFCRAVGAEAIYAAGHPCLEKYPLYAVMVQMQAQRSTLPQTQAVPVAVTADTLSQWKALYNQKMAAVPNAAYMDDAAAAQMLGEGSGYFVHQDGAVIGICKGSGDTVEAIASIVRGAGQDVLAALCKVLQGEQVHLLVARSNTLAVKLYERLGFTDAGEISRWYEIQ